MEERVRPQRLVALDEAQREADHAASWIRRGRPGMNPRTALQCAIGTMALLIACRHVTPEKSAPRNPAIKQIPGRPDIEANASRMIDEGRHVFRHDTFGSEEFWGGKL